MRVAETKFGAENNFKESCENITRNWKRQLCVAFVQMLVNIRDAVVEYVEFAGQALDFGLSAAVDVVIEFAAEPIWIP